MRIHSTQKPKLEVDYFNFYAIAVLESLGNRMPTQEEIDDMEALLRTFFRKLTHAGVRSSLPQHHAH